MPAPGDDTLGDFDSLKQMLTSSADVGTHLIRVYQYVIARFDVDGFRIDTLRYLKGGLALTFGNAVREYALSIGKKNFFTFGEVWAGDAEDEIARFIGRNTNAGGDLVGVDAALDYPLFDVLKAAVKGFGAPREVMAMYQRRKFVEKDILSSHGDATRYFVTFLDNHDVKAWLRHADAAAQAELDLEVSLGIACLACLPGIPCIYYGTEQGLHGAGSDPAVREALWGGPGLDDSSRFYAVLSRIAAVRAMEPALRYGRIYFRQLSSNGVAFGFSGFRPGVLAFSRILNDREMLVVANFDKSAGQRLNVVVDATLNPVGRALRVLFSNLEVAPAALSAVRQLSGVTVEEVDGSISDGPVNAIQLELRVGEVLMLT
ncbi:MAG TPA: alpha-amylase family glycosyl hydrolase [Roseiarcus sp.]|jgi:glycosidase|nr:alpha-amylase family glycosyl hydrolase [Roseiarcus sp.]